MFTDLAEAVGEVFEAEPVWERLILNSSGYDLTYAAAREKAKTKEYQTAPAYLAKKRARERAYKNDPVFRAKKNKRDAASKRRRYHAKKLQEANLRTQDSLNPNAVL